MRSVAGWDGHPEMGSDRFRTFIFSSCFLLLFIDQLHHPVLPSSVTGRSHVLIYYQRGVMGSHKSRPSELMPRDRAPQDILAFAHTSPPYVYPTTPSRHCQTNVAVILIAQSYGKFFSPVFPSSLKRRSL